MVLLLFHFTVAFLVGAKLLSKQATFASAFFTLYLLLSVADMGHYLWFLYMQRIWRYGVFSEWRPSSSACTRAVFAIGFFSYLQFSCHLAIAFNRYTAIWRPMSHSKIWSGRRLSSIVASVLFVSAVCASVRLLLNTQPFETEYGFLCNVQDESTIGISDINGFVAAGLVLITCVASFCFEMATFTAFRRMNEQARREHHEDYRLLIYAMILLVANLLMAVQYVCIYLVKPRPDFSVTLHPYIVGVLCFSGPISLFFNSKRLRENYARFYRLQRKNHIADTSLSFVRLFYKNGNLELK